MSALLPSHVIDASGQLVPSSTLKGKVLGLYFSAHWCPPCRLFTPRLCEWFDRFKRNHPHKDDLALVFVSADRDEDAFQSYRLEMNFHSLPYADREAKTSLVAQLGVKGYPTLAFVDSSGNTLTREGRSVVLTDPSGERFPWAPKSIEEILGNNFIDAKVDKFTAQALRGKIVGLFFAANWCIECKDFSKILANVYEKVKANGELFEVVFISSDRTVYNFNDFLETMPWLALPYAETERKLELAKRLGVDGIPSFVIIDANHHIITKEGRDAIEADPLALHFPWRPKAVRALTCAEQHSILEHPSLVVECDAEQAISLLSDVANTEFKKSQPLLRFYYVEDRDSDLFIALKKAARLASEKLFIVNLPLSKKYIPADQTLSAANIETVVAAFVSGRIDWVTFK